MAENLFRSMAGYCLFFERQLRLKSLLALIKIELNLAKCFCGLIFFILVPAMSDSITMLLDLIHLLRMKRLLSH